MTEEEKIEIKYTNFKEAILFLIKRILNDVLQPCYKENNMLFDDFLSKETIGIFLKVEARYVKETGNSILTISNYQKEKIYLMIYYTIFRYLEDNKYFDKTNSLDRLKVSSVFKKNMEEIDGVNIIKRNICKEIS
jgi:hypothetical protein